MVRLWLLVGTNPRKYPERNQERVPSRFITLISHPWRITVVKTIRASKSISASLIGSTQGSIVIVGIEGDDIWVGSERASFL